MGGNLWMFTMVFELTCGMSSNWMFTNVFKPNIYYRNLFAPLLFPVKNKYNNGEEDAANPTNSSTDSYSNTRISWVILCAG